MQHADRHYLAGEQKIMNIINSESAQHFHLDEQSLQAIRQFGEHFPGGFFIYREEGNKELLYANSALIEIFGCRNLNEFKQHTGFVYEGMLHPDVREKINSAIKTKYSSSKSIIGHIIYRILRRDGATRWVDTYGHYAVSEEYGGVYFVFAMDITEQKLATESSKELNRSVFEALTSSYDSVMLIKDLDTERISLFRHPDENDDISHIRTALRQANYTEATNHYIDTMVLPEDREWMRREIALPNIKKELAESKRFAITYRRILNGEIRYYRVEYIRLKSKDSKSGIIYAFKDVDDEVRNEKKLKTDLQAAILAQKQKEKEFYLVQEMALKDPLTGIKNKRAFKQRENQLNQAINKNEPLQFALVVCDVNDLKVVNDTQGHLAGDQYIKNTCSFICHVFQHSPVFRFGGDEFVVILSGADYENREQLMQELDRNNQKNLLAGDVVIANGLAEFDPLLDTCTNDVLRRADECMYENKILLKSMR